MKKVLLMSVLALGLSFTLNQTFAEETTGTNNTVEVKTTETLGTANTDATKPFLERQKELEAKKAEFERKQGERKAELEKKQTERMAELETKKTERENEMMKHQGERAKKILEQLKHRLEKLNERVDGAKELSDTDKSEIGAKIDAEITKIEALKEKAGSAATADEIKALAPEIKAELQMIREYGNAFMGRLLVAKLGKLIDRTESKIAVVEAKISEIKSSGKDTAALETKLGEAKSHLGEAKTIYADAKTKYIAALSAADMESAMKEAATLAKQVNGRLQSAHRALQEMIPMANELVKPAESSGATATPAVTNQ